MGALERLCRLTSLPDDNARRWRSGLGAHTESYFVRANDPLQRRALWIKATILAGPQVQVAEAWVIAFDGERGVVTARRQTVPLADSKWSDHPTTAELGDCRFAFGPLGGQARGCWPAAAAAASAPADGGSASGSSLPIEVDLRWEARPGDIGASLCMLPHRCLLRGPLPRNKLLTPLPALQMAGTLDLGAERWVVDGWLGMQGHNWGPSHADSYAWGQVIFADGEGGTAWVEAVAARLRVGGARTPWLAGMVIHDGVRAWRFDHIVDIWRQRNRVGDLDWRLALRGPPGKAELCLTARAAEVACLRYDEPSGDHALCFNSKLARAELWFQPTAGPLRRWASEHGGALELLRRQADPRFAVLA